VTVEVFAAEEREEPDAEEPDDPDEPEEPEPDEPDDPEEPVEPEPEEPDVSGPVPLTVEEITGVAAAVGICEDSDVW
jgi:hypothetical protein